MEKRAKVLVRMPKTTLERIERYRAQFRMRPRDSHPGYPVNLSRNDVIVILLEDALRVVELPAGNNAGAGTD